MCRQSKNMFDDMFDEDSDVELGITDELKVYLEAPPVKIKPDGVISWWYENMGRFPHLSRMALDHLTIPGKLSALYPAEILTVSPATSVNVERVFSQGRILLSHVRNRLAAQSTRAVLCLGSWSLLEDMNVGLKVIHEDDVLSVTKKPELPEEETVQELKEGWDKIELFL